MNVKISNDLLYAVDSKIDGMCGTDVKLNLGIDESEAYKFKQPTQELLELIWGEHLPLKDVIPSDWCVDLASVYGSYFYLKTSNKDGQGERNIRVEYKGNKKTMFLPPDQSCGHTYRVDRDKAVGLLKELIDRSDTIHSIHSKWDKINKEVKTYLRSARSLNAALKAWPELKAFIPHEYIERVNRKLERVNKEKTALSEVDRDLAVTSATLVKLSCA